MPSDGYNCWLHALALIMDASWYIQNIHTERFTTAQRRYVLAQYEELTGIRLLHQETDGGFIDHNYLALSSVCTSRLLKMLNRLRASVINIHGHCYIVVPRNKPVMESFMSIRALQIKKPSFLNTYDQIGMVKLIQYARSSAVV
jgi:hypothetical protein